MCNGVNIHQLSNPRASQQPHSHDAPRSLPQAAALKSLNHALLFFFTGSALKVDTHPHMPSSR
jgi:hypothetical protein